MKKMIMILYAALALSACCGTGNQGNCSTCNSPETFGNSCIKPYGCSCTSTYSASCACSGGEKVTY